MERRTNEWSDRRTSVYRDAGAHPKKGKEGERSDKLIWPKRDLPPTVLRRSLLPSCFFPAITALRCSPPSVARGQFSSFFSEVNFIPLFFPTHNSYLPLSTSPLLSSPCLEVSTWHYRLCLSSLFEWHIIWAYCNFQRGLWFWLVFCPYLLRLWWLLSSPLVNKVFQLKLIFLFSRVIR